VLIIANNQALASFGKIAIIGEITCITSAIILVPAIMIAARDRLLKKKISHEPVKARTSDPKTHIVEQHD
jgi:predicted RND superfamily exporter protein